MKVSLFVMSRKGLKVLESIVKNNLTDSIDLVICSHDKNMANDYYDEMKMLCKVNNIRFADKKDNIPINTKYSISVSWRWLINLDNDKQLIVLHDSLLPKYRGFAPLVNMLLNKESQIGVTALIASNEYDKGDIVGQKKTDVVYPIKITDAINKVSILFENLVCELITKLNNGTGLKPVKQKEDEATYSIWRDEEDYAINWNESADDILHKIYCLGYPFKGASTIADNQKYRILSASLVNDVYVENRMPGKVIFMNEGRPTVICGTGLLRIDEMICEDGTPTLPFKKFRLRFK